MPIEKRRNYRNVFHAFYRIIKEEGLFTLWRGSSPTICRAMAMNMGMMATYDEVKEFLVKNNTFGETKIVRIKASLISGFVCSFLSLPFDNIKTKMQKM